MFNNWIYQIDEKIVWGLVIVVFIIVISLRSLIKAAQLQYIEQYSFHQDIKNKLKEKHHGLTDEQLNQVFQGLQDYLYICNKAGCKMIPMPSRIVDDAWCEFVLFSRQYEKFCQEAFGRFLHHTYSEAMIRNNQVQGIKVIWHLACCRAKTNPRKPLALPLLFAIDAQLAIPDGFIYSLSEPAGQYCSNCDNGLIYNLNYEQGNKHYSISDIGCACKGECIAC